MTLTPTRPLPLPHRAWLTPLASPAAATSATAALPTSNCPVQDTAAEARR